MDTLSHGLWAVILAKFYQKKTTIKINFWWAAFWGAFPDLFAFAPLFIAMMLAKVGIISPIPSMTPREPFSPDTHILFQFTSELYNISHSLVIFGLVFFFVWALRYFLTQKSDQCSALPFVMMGWLLHILADIPTHTYRFFPTPFLWPLSTFTFNGFSWGTPWFMIANYSLIGLCFYLLREKRNGSSST